MYIYIYVYLSLCKIVDKFSCITMCFLPKQDAVWSVYPCSLSMADQCIFARCYVILDLTYTRIYHATSSAKIPVLLSCWWRAMSNHVRKSFIFDLQCSMFNVQMERGSNYPTRGQMHHREVTHVRHHQRSMGQHVVTQKNNNVSIKQKSKLGSCQQTL